MGGPLLSKLTPRPVPAQAQPERIHAMQFVNDEFSITYIRVISGLSRRFLGFGQYQDFVLDRLPVLQFAPNSLGTFY